MTDTTYTLTKHLLDTDFGAAVEKVTRALKAEGFGILTEIDIQKTFKAKLEIDFPRYLILGACNPTLAHQALDIAPAIGALLPCNVVVREAGGGVEISIIDPRAMFSVVDRDDLKPVVDSVDAKMRRVLGSL